MQPEHKTTDPIEALRALGQSYPCPAITDALAEMERLRKIEEAAEYLVQNDMAGIVEDSAWARLREALGIEVCPT